jgi:hypothetical protein
VQDSRNCSLRSVVFEAKPLMIRSDSKNAAVENAPDADIYWSYLIEVTAFEVCQVNSVGKSSFVVSESEELKNASRRDE